MSVDTLNADLATLRLPPVTADEWVTNQDALDRVEAELSRLRSVVDDAVGAIEADRLREERDAALVNEAVYYEERDTMWRKWKAAEARCARLQQALREIELDSRDPRMSPSHAGFIARKALAGPDTPADRTAAPESRATSTQSEGSPEGDDGGTGAAATPADSHSTLLGREISGTDQCFPKSADSQEDET